MTVDTQKKVEVYRKYNEYVREHFLMKTLEQTLEIPIKTAVLYKGRLNCSRVCARRDDFALGQQLHRDRLFL